MKRIPAAYWSSLSYLISLALLSTIVLMVLIKMTQLPLCLRRKDLSSSELFKTFNT